METNHTPGPWVTRHDHITSEECRNKHFSDKICSLEWGNQEENQENAKLIAAAPDLLEALQDIIKQCEKSHLQIGADLSDSIMILGKKDVELAINGRE